MKIDVSIPVAGLSLRAAARRVGCTHRAISQAVKAARIPQAADGTVQPADVDRWNAGRRAKRGGAHRKVSEAKSIRTKVSEPLEISEPVRPAAPPTPINPQALAEVLSGSGMFQDRASAELARDSYMARLRQLEFEERSGRLLDAAKVRASIAGACHTVRTRLLALPAERAVAIARCKTPAEAEDLLRSLITQALEALAEHFAGRVAP